MERFPELGRKERVRTVLRNLRDPRGQRGRAGIV
jgi:hypothetical protein